MTFWLGSWFQGSLRMRPAELALALDQRAALDRLVPIGGDQAFGEQPLRHAGGFAFALGHRPGQAGDVQPLDGRGNDDGHEQQRGQHFGQRETAAALHRSAGRMTRVP